MNGGTRRGRCKYDPLCHLATRREEWDDEEEGRGDEEGGRGDEEGGRGGERDETDDCSASWEG